MFGDQICASLIIQDRIDALLFLCLLSAKAGWNCRYHVVPTCIWVCLYDEMLNCSHLGQDDSAVKTITRSRRAALGQFLSPNTPYLKRYPPPKRVFQLLSRRVWKFKFLFFSEFTVSFQAQSKSENVSPGEPGQFLSHLGVCIFEDFLIKNC